MGYAGLTPFARLNAMSSVAEVRLSFAPSGHLVARADGTFDYQKAMPRKPLWRLCVVSSDGITTLGRWWVSRPDKAELLDTVRRALAPELPRCRTIVIPRTTLDREPALLEWLDESHWTVELPSNAADGGAHHVRNADRFLVDVHTYLHFYSEAKASLTELAAVSQPTGLVTVPHEDKPRCDAVDHLARAICALRGRDPDEGRRRHWRAARGAPTNERTHSVAEEDPVDTVRDRIRREGYHWIHDAAVEHLCDGLAQWQRSDGEARQSLEQQVGRYILEATLALARSRPGRHHALIGHEITSAFGVGNRWRTLLPKWAARELGRGVQGLGFATCDARINHYAEGAIFARRAVVQFQPEPAQPFGPWIQSLPLQGSLIVALNEASAGLWFGRFPSGREFAHPSERPHEALFDFLMRLLDEPHRFHMGIESPKSRVLARPSNDRPPECHVPMIAFCEDQLPPLGEALANWRDQANAKLRGWHAGCHIASTQLQAPTEWPVEDAWV